MIKFKVMILSVCSVAFISGIASGVIIYGNKYPKTIKGYIYVRSEKPLNIIYTNGLGIDEIISTDELDAPFELGRDVKVYDYRISIYSDAGPQTFMVQVHFEGADSSNNFEKVMYDQTEYDFRGQYIPPWSDILKPEINL